MVNTVFLMGYMGSGKTVVGKYLSNSTNYKFYDLGLQIKSNNEIRKDWPNYKGFTDYVEIISDNKIPIKKIDIANRKFSVSNFIFN